MKEITKSCCLHHISGGNSGYDYDPNCPGCNGEWDNEKSDTAQVIGNAAGSIIGQRIGATLGSAGGVLGAITGAYMGNEVGKFIDKSIRTNYLPPIGDDRILLDYIKNTQVW